MPRKYFRKYLPSHESVRNHKYLGKLGRFLHHPNLWHLNRRSVSGGVAVGMFSGLVPGPLQMLTAALLAIPLRVNLPVALLTTLYTNPFTIVPLYLVAYWLGALVTGGTGVPMTEPPAFSWANVGEWLHALADWALALATLASPGNARLGLAGSAVVRCWRAWVIVGGVAAAAGRP
jgi:uncharacterized protein (DUF2062 family)